ncbi:AP-3 complex subunit beta-2-like [Achroia grisella]|uniref:AP-3 complex subunit beta-2-like n=1 Tax=Achroia grisella TaxID=688607 RepID=UPI0027D337CD|nr:AP-3 complex subunit beta-2-like [Achroia grisella]
MTSISSYNNVTVVTGEVEYPANDPASGAFFQPDYKKNDDLKMMLDGSKDSLKLEAMKRIIGMIAKGRDASDLFPAVVKNVVSKNIEVKKLVYVYLVRYAEEQQDLALLSISTFQRALKDPNQLIRASALRVLSSIRVPMIVPIVMLAIRDSASDMSPYVRKTAAHAIPKLYSLDPEQKEELVAIIDKLLSDKAPLVVGSAAMAFNEVCGDRMSLIHRSYRKLCSLLADVDEWGQLALLNMLTLYAKTCFPDPNTDSYNSDSETEKPFYESSSDEGEEAQAGDGETRGGRRPRAASVEPDLRLLLRAAKPLLQSRNSGVVMAVAQLMYHCGPGQELSPVAKAMVRLLRAPPEVQSVVLTSVAALTLSKRSLFEPFLKSFFVRTSDPTHIKLLKLEILTNLATEASAPVVLREFQTYVSSNDKVFAGATIQAIGRLAVQIQSETETCLNGLLHLLSSKDEWVVCEAVVVVKRVVGGGASSARAAVARAARLLRADRLAGAARAAAVWLVAEHGASRPRAAAVLAHLASAFADQEELVKLQLLSLAVKLHVAQPAAGALCRYVAALARYDASYDVRDRARLLRRFLQPRGHLAARAAQVFCPDKPKPQVHSTFRDRQQFTVGSLSMYTGSAASGYRPLPPAPPHALHGALRDVGPPAGPAAAPRAPAAPQVHRTPHALHGALRDVGPPAGPAAAPRAPAAPQVHRTPCTGPCGTWGPPPPRAPPPPHRYTARPARGPAGRGAPAGPAAAPRAPAAPQKDKSFYSEPESSSSGSASSSSESSSSEESSDEEESNDEDKKPVQNKQKQTNNYRSSSSGSSESGSESGDSESESDSEADSGDGDSQHSDDKEDEPPARRAPAREQQKNEKSNLELLLELDEAASALPTITPTCGGLLSPLTAPTAGTADATENAITPVGPSFVSAPYAAEELVGLVSWGGLVAHRRWPRTPHLYSHRMCSVEVRFTNHTPRDVTNIRINKKTLTGSRAIHDFAPVAVLEPVANATVILGIDFADTIQPIEFTMACSLGEVAVAVRPPVGELIRAVNMSDERWASEQRLRGMTEVSIFNIKWKSGA